LVNKGLFVSTLIILLTLSGCGNSENSEAYRRGYQNGIAQICASCSDNAEDDHQQSLCDQICN